MDEEAINPFKSKLKFRDSSKESANLKNGYYQSKESQSDML